jgi:hypothetical protein
MLTREEFLQMANEQYDKIAENRQEDGFYNYEKVFEGIWIEFGRQTLEASISRLPTNPRKKKHD